MNMNKGFVIKQFTPAADWFAVYDEGEDGLEFLPLVGWAIVADRTMEGYDDIIPMVHDLHEGVSPAEEDNMVGVIHASQRENPRPFIRKLSA